MRTPLLAAGFAAALTLSLGAQQGPNSEVNFVGAIKSTQVGPRANCGSGLTTTLFQTTTGQAGNMWDIIVGTDMTIECIDFNLAGTGPVDLEIWYCPITCVGNEVNPAAWTQLAAVSGVIPQGSGLATNVDISGNGVTFSAGQSYGMYAFIQGYTSSAIGIMWYTNSGTSNLYLGDHCDVQTQFGAIQNWGGVYNPREWNGTLYTEIAGPAGPSLASTGNAGGSMQFDFANFGPGESIAVVYGPAGSVTGNAPCGPVTVDLLPLNYPPVSGLILLTADAGGAASITQNVPGGAAGLLVQGVGTTSCGVSNSVTIQ